MTIYFDMDGTIADLYGVDDWLNHLENHSTFPYENAKPMLNFSRLARLLNSLQKKGYKVGIISWCSRENNPRYDAEVTKAKKRWLAYHLPSVVFDEIQIQPYGYPKQNFCCGNDILFDDEAKNRDTWTGEAHNEKEILEILKNLLTVA